MTYKDKLLDPRWQRKRLEVLQRADFACELCSDNETTLHIHHETYNGNNPWDTPIEKLKCLCKHCHATVEFFKTRPFPVPYRVDKIDTTTSIEMYAFIKINEYKFLVYGKILPDGIYEYIYILNQMTLEWVLNVLTEE